MRLEISGEKKCPVEFSNYVIFRMLFFPISGHVMMRFKDQKKLNWPFEFRLFVSSVYKMPNKAAV